MASGTTQFYRRERKLSHVIFARALRLTQDETAQILNGRSGQIAGSAAQVHAWSRGWVSGLMLALAGGEHQRPLIANDNELSSDNLSAYFSSQVMRLEEAAFKLFLIKTSVLPFVTAAMARELTGADGAASILERAYRSNLFTEKRGAGWPFVV